MRFEGRGEVTDLSAKLPSWPVLLERTSQRQGLADPLVLASCSVSLVGGAMIFAKLPSWPVLLEQTSQRQGLAGPLVLASCSVSSRSNPSPLRGSPRCEPGDRLSAKPPTWPVLLERTSQRQGLAGPLILASCSVPSRSNPSPLRGSPRREPGDRLLAKPPCEPVLLPCGHDSVD